MIVNQKILTLALGSLIAISVIGCNGSSQSSTSSTPTSKVTLKALSGSQYLSGANISLDQNKDGKCETGVGKTDSNGSITFNSKNNEAIVCVNA